MASLTKRANGTFRIQFLDGDRRRQSIGLGKVSDERAREIKAKVEALNADVISGHAWKPETARWLTKLDADLYAKLADAGLVPKREAVGHKTVAAFLDAYIDGRSELAPNTISHLKRARRNMVEYFGGERRLDSVTPGDADEFRRWLRTTMAENTARRICGRAKQFFRAAERKRLILDSPFADMKGTSVQANRSREYFVSREDAARVINACIDNQWKLIFALARFGGLRCPSDVLALKWGHVDWDLGRFLVDSPKTGPRVVPLFPELRPHLQAVLDELLEDFDPKLQRLSEQHVITRYREPNSNLRTQLERIIRKAGLKPWPKPFQNLRSTRETELAEQYPMHVVCAWIGNSQAVAAKHYLQVTDDHFAAAATAPGAPALVQSPVPGTVTSGNGEQAGTIETRKNPEDLAIPRGLSDSSEDDQAPPDSHSANTALFEIGRWYITRLRRQRVMCLHPWTGPQSPLVLPANRPHVNRDPLALARLYQGLLDNGIVGTRAELARHLGVSRARVTQVLRRLKALTAPCKTGPGERPPAKLRLDPVKASPTRPEPASPPNSTTMEGRT